MTLKAKHRLVSLDQNEAPHANEMIDELYRTRVEAIHHRVSGTAIIAPYPFIETGSFSISGNGSHAADINIPLKSVVNRYLYVGASVYKADFDATVIDVTSTQITVSVHPRNGAAAFTNTTTAAVNVHWMIMGSAP